MPSSASSRHTSVASPKRDDLAGVEVVFGEERELGGIVADGLFDLVDELVVGDGVGLLPFKPLALRVDGLVQVEEGVALGGIPRLGGLNEVPVRLERLLLARRGQFREFLRLLDELRAQFRVREDDKPVFSEKRLAQERELFHVHFAETGDFDGVGGLEDVALDGALGVTFGAVGSGDVLLGGVDPGLSGRAVQRVVERGRGVGGGRGLLLRRVRAVQDAARVVSGGGEARSVFIHRNAPLLEDVRHRDGEDERARGVGAAVVVEAVVEALLVGVVEGEHPLEEKLALRMVLRHRLRLGGGGDLLEEGNARLPRVVRELGVECLHVGGIDLSDERARCRGHDRPVHQPIDAGKRHLHAGLRRHAVVHGEHEGVEVGDVVLGHASLGGDEEHAHRRGVEGVGERTERVGAEPGFSLSPYSGKRFFSTSSRSWRYPVSSGSASYAS